MWKYHTGGVNMKVQNVSAGDRLVHWLSEQVIESYLDSCLDRGLAPKTVKWYRWHLRRARDWLEAEPGYHALDFLSEEGLRAYYRSTRDLARTSRRALVAAMQAFGTWLEGYKLENPATSLQKPKAHKRLPKVLPPSEVERLLEVAEQEPPRERALLLLFLDTGLRVSEVARLKRADLDLASGRLVVCNGKGGKDRVVFYCQRTADALRTYLNTHTHAYVFVSQRVGPPPAQVSFPPKPMTPSGIRQILRKVAGRYGFSDLTPHTLRRTCGTELAAHGVDLATIADQFGHADVATTTIYTRLADSRRQEVLERASVVNRHAIPVPTWPIVSGE
jgi:integrase/recombinase XerD